MTFAEKITELRKQRGWSQEELGERLGVTRQTISKWELGMTTPEMEKLAAMSELFGISLDELVKGEKPQSAEPASDRQTFLAKPTTLRSEYVSRRTWRGKPLVHINFRGRANGFFAVGLMARGIFAVGLLSVGVVSAGLLSVGVIALAAIAAVGVFAQGSAAVGIFAFGLAAVGVVSFGLVSFGWLSYGVVSAGTYAVGAVASGQIAIGNTASGIVVLGKETVGEVELHLPVTAEQFAEAVRSRLPNTPDFIVRLLANLAENVEFN